MSDDTRQAQAIVRPPMHKNETYTVFNDADLNIQVRLEDAYLMVDVTRNPGTVLMHGHHIPIELAADAIGRERVSEAIRPEPQSAYVDSLAHQLVMWLNDEIEWSDARRALALSLGSAWVILPKSTLTAAPAERSDLDTLTAEVGAWGERTFPQATGLSIVRHLQEEVVELVCAVVNVWEQVRDGNVNIAEEAADCLLLLMHLAHRNGFSLMDEARKKFATNQTRTWNTVTAGGYVKHDEVKP